MSKKDIQKRIGQLYAEAIQYGYSEKDIIDFIEVSFETFLEPKKKLFYSKTKNKDRDL